MIVLCCRSLSQGAEIYIYIFLLYSLKIEFIFSACLKTREFQMKIYLGKMLSAPTMLSQ
jgi:hypothetical protein